MHPHIPSLVPKLQGSRFVPDNAPWRFHARATYKLPSKPPALRFGTDRQYFGELSAQVVAGLRIECLSSSKSSAWLRRQEGT
jgi:hypothetical protein